MTETTFRNRSRRRAVAAGAAILLLAVGLAAIAGCYEGENFEQAKAYKIDSRSQLIGGEKAHGNLGDYMLENDKIRVILNAHPTDASVNKYGGSIIDADIVRFENNFDPTEEGYDRFLQLTPVFDVKTFGLETYRNSAPVYKVDQDSFKIVADGADGGAAVIKVTGVMEEIIELLKFIPVPLTSLPIRAETTYTLKPGKNWVEITTTYTLLERDKTEAAETVEIPLRPLTAEDNPLINIFTGDAVGDAIFFGDSVDMFGPGEWGFADDWYIEEQYNHGRSTLFEPPTVDWVAGVSDKIGYAIVSDDGPISLPIMVSFLTFGFEKVAEPGNTAPLPGSTYTYTRYFVVDEGDLAGLLDHVIDLRGWDSGRVEGTVISATDGPRGLRRRGLCLQAPTADRGRLAGPGRGRLRRDEPVPRRAARRLGRHAPARPVQPLYDRLGPLPAGRRRPLFGASSRSTPRRASRTTS